MRSATESKTSEGPAWVADSARISVAPRPLTGERQRPALGPSLLEAGCWIGESCLVGAATRIGQRAVLDHGTIVGAAVRIGSGTLVTHRAQIGDGAVIGASCVVAGFVCEEARLGNGCRVFGSLVHRQLAPHLPWDAERAQEVAPALEDHVFVGWGATVIGEIALGKRSFVCAGAIVTKSVPPRSIVHGVNEVVKYDDWPGALAHSGFFDL